MLYNCSILLVCLLGCSVVQGYTHEMREKPLMRETRYSDLLSYALSLIDEISSKTVAVPSCSSAIASFTRNVLASRTTDSAKARQIILMVKAFRKTNCKYN